MGCYGKTIHIAIMQKTIINGSMMTKSSDPSLQLFFTGKEKKGNSKHLKQGKVLNSFIAVCAEILMTDPVNAEGTY